MLSILKAAFLFGAVAVQAAPIIEDRAAAVITSDQLSQFTLFSQFAGAAYCFGNVQGGNKKLACSKNGGACPLVESATTSVPSAFRLGFSNTTGFVAVDDTHKLIVISIQGTQAKTNLASVLTDLQIDRVNTPLCGTANKNDGCEVHMGFYNAALDVQATVTKAVATAKAAHPDYKVVATGHSLGAAVSALLATMLRNAGTNVDLYTYGQPHLGTVDISNYIQSQSPSKGTNFRITHFNDVVPQLPPHDLGDWDHYYPEFFININEGTVGTSNVVQVDANLFSKAGNEGKTSGLGVIVDILTGVDAHGLYFGKISGCNSAAP
ncbi:Alpha/Beta hydrolase protein [Tricladium varicosporioides]|nr:Alpha/Beta hydrolase protein [Hymenoscyphus varicosporioides]